MIREFDTGATRDGEVGKIDYEGHLSPLVLKAYGEYMNRCRTMKDGSLRDSDNWQKGMPLSVYMKSLFRHFLDLWHQHRSVLPNKQKQIEDCCGILFNTQGYLFELLRDSA